MHDPSSSKWLRMAAIVVLALTGGCSLIGQPPSIADDGSVVGGEPRLSSLLEVLSKGRPNRLESEHRQVSYVISIYPMRHMLLLEGVLPLTEDKIIANYTMVASVDSRESAEIAIITETTAKEGGDGLSCQHSQAFRWESEHWVAKSFAELQAISPGR